MFHRRLLIVLLILPMTVLRASDTTRPDTEEPEEPSSLQESEAKGIIPDGGLTISTQPITPIALLAEKNSHDQALEELAVADGLMAKGRVEAASDVSLQAYDDLMAVYVRKRNKANRKKLLADRRRAATLYVDSSLAYIRNYVDKEGGASGAIVEAHARVGDLRDVAVNYPDLNKKINLALEQYAVKLSSASAP